MSAMIGDARILLRLLRGMPRHRDLAERLESFYAPQAALYDNFREGLLHGRRDLIADLVIPAGGRVVELGAGTGSNLDLLGERVHGLECVELVDLCPSLLARARERAQRFSNVVVTQANVCDFRPARAADCVVFSYSLTMIPDWRRALANALTMLRPGGQLAVVDFMPAPARNPLLRAFWNYWFGHDGVRLDDAHVSSLREMLPKHTYIDGSGSVPYVPGLKMSYYRFIGTK